MLETIQIETGPRPTGSVIWLHGLGADGHDFAPLVPELVRPGERALRFVFPHAPMRPVTLNGGYVMRAWYDIQGLERHFSEDEVGIEQSRAEVGALIRRENERGIASERIAVAGFSQGGAIALHVGTRSIERLAGVMSLSAYLILAGRFATEHSAANLTTPFFLAHGTQDPVVHPQRGEESCQLLRAAGYAVEWHTYRMPHSLCPEEVADIAAWLRRVL